MNSENEYNWKALEYLMNPEKKQVEQSPVLLCWEIPSEKFHEMLVDNSHRVVSLYEKKSIEKSFRVMVSPSQMFKWQNKEIKYNFQLEVMEGNSAASFYISSNNVESIHVSVRIKTDSFVNQKDVVMHGAATQDSEIKICLFKDFQIGFFKYQNKYRFEIELLPADDIPDVSLIAVNEESSLASDLDNLFHSGLGADFTIFCEVNGNMATSYEVHKSILMGRSEVLAAMLSKNDMSENKTNSTIISDIGPEPLKEMIRFLYTDQVQNIDDHAAELLMASEKYNLPKLKKIAEKSLCKTLNLGNVIRVAAYAYIHNGETVVAAATRMIVDKFEEITAQPEWRNFVRHHPDLLVEIHKNLTKKK